LNSRSKLLTNVVVLALIAIVFSIVGILVTVGVIRPLKNLIGTVTTLSTGDHSVTVPGQDRKDELGDLGRAVEVFRNNLIQTEELTANQLRQHEESAQISAHREEVTQKFGSEVEGVLNHVSSDVMALQSETGSMSDMAKDTKERSQSVASASEITSSNIQTVAAAAEELTSSIGEISHQVTSAAGIAQSAVEKSGEAHETIQSLISAADQSVKLLRLSPISQNRQIYSL
jgi:methyl-accepting chemotaxis protein